MGSGPSSTTTQSGTQATSPWAPAIPYLSNVLSTLGNAYYNPSGYQSAANSQLLSEAYKVPEMGAAGNALDTSLFNYNTNPQQSMIGSSYNAATGLSGNAYNTATGMIGPTEAAAFAPVTNSYSTAVNALDPYLNPNYTNPMAVPGFANTLQAIGQQTQQATDSLFAAAGRDPAGNAQAAKAAATATMNAEAPYLTSEYNALAGQQQGAANSIGALGLGTGQTLGQIGLQGAGLFGNLGLGEGALLGNLGIGAANAITGQQQAQNATNLEGVSLAEGLPGLWTTPGQARLTAANSVAQQPIMNLAGLESLINPVAGLGNTTQFAGQGTTQQSNSMMSNILGGILGGVGLFGSGGIFPGAAMISPFSDV